MIHIFDISYLIMHYGYIGIFLVVFLESGLIFLLPGDTLLFTAGLLASTGLLSIHALIPMVFIATFLGGLMGYHIGIHLEKLHNYSFFRKLLQKKYLDKGHRFFEKYGKETILFCRFIGVIRTFAPIVAGIVRMNYFSFLKYNALGSLFWSLTVTLLGYFLGRIIPGLEHSVSLIMILVVVLSMLPVLFHMWKETRKARV